MPRRKSQSSARSSAANEQSALFDATSDLSDAAPPRMRKRKRETPSPSPHTYDDDAALLPPPPAPPADAELDAPPTTHTVPIRATNWDDYPQDPCDPITNPTFCALCYLAQSDQEQASNKRWQKLLTYYRENYYGPNPFLFVSTVQDIYNTLIRGHLVNGQNEVRRGPAWSARNIWEHPLEHAIVPASIQEYAARSMFTALRTMDDNGCYERDEGQEKARINPRYKELWLKTWKELDKLLPKLQGQRNNALFGL
jgi:hypothetical protein